MDTLYLLIPLSVIAMFGVLGVFAWAVHAGQFDELEHEGQCVLVDADRPAASSGTDTLPPCH